jgi:hypothetical protein
MQPDCFHYTAEKEDFMIENMWLIVPGGQHRVSVLTSVWCPLSRIERKLSYTHHRGQSQINL